MTVPGKCTRFSGKRQPALAPRSAMLLDFMLAARAISSLTRFAEA